MARRTTVEAGQFNELTVSGGRTESARIPSLVVTNRRENRGGEGFRFERPTREGTPNATAAPHGGVSCDRLGLLPGAAWEQL